MKAFVLREAAPIQEHPLELEEVPRPEPDPGELLIEVRACGICRTDLHVIEGDLPRARRPIVPGHQVVGTVEEVGDDVRGWEPGDRAGVAWLRGTCGDCEFCRDGRENLCGDSRYTGYHDHGGFAEYTVAPADWTYRIPETFGDAEATPLLCAGIIGYRALRRARVPESGRLGLYGFGSSAHIVIQIALHRGHEVVVATRSESHQQLAREMGASWAGGAYEGLPEPAHSSIIFAPAGPLVPVALRSLKKGGTLSLAGIHMSPIPEMEYEPCLFHEKEVRSVEANTREDGQGLLDEAAEIPIRPRVTTLPWTRANEGLQRLEEDGFDGTGVLVMEGP